MSLVVSGDTGTFNFWLHHVRMWQTSAPSEREIARLLRAEERQKELTEAAHMHFYDERSHRTLGWTDEEFRMYREDPFHSELICPACFMKDDDDLPYYMRCLCS